MKKQNGYDPRYLYILRILTTAVFAVFVVFCIICSVSVSKYEKTGGISLFDYQIRTVGTDAVIIQNDAYITGDVVAVTASGKTTLYTVSEKTASADGYTILLTAADGNVLNTTSAENLILGRIKSVNPTLGKCIMYLGTIRGTILALILPAILLGILVLTVYLAPKIPVKIIRKAAPVCDTHVEPLEYDGSPTD